MADPNASWTFRFNRDLVFISHRFANGSGTHEALEYSIDGQSHALRQRLYYDADVAWQTLQSWGLWQSAQTLDGIRFLSRKSVLGALREHNPIPIGVPLRSIQFRDKHPFSEITYPCGMAVSQDGL